MQCSQSHASQHCAAYGARCTCPQPAAAPRHLRAGNTSACQWTDSHETLLWPLHLQAFATDHLVLHGKFHSVVLSIVGHALATAAQQIKVRDPSKSHSFTQQFVYDGGEDAALQGLHDCLCCVGNYLSACE